MPRQKQIKTRKDRAGEFVIVCQNMRSLFNVGSVFRSADCFGASKIYLTGITGTPPRKEISKVALGAELYLPWEYAKQPLRLIKKLKAEGYTIAALEQAENSESLYKYNPRFPLALILGYEVTGLPKSILKICDHILEIPLHGQKESLNVASAFAVAASRIAEKAQK